MNKNIVLLWQGQFVSQLGSQAFSITMMFWLMEAVGSSALMGSILALSLLPSIILGPIAGAIADRYSRKFIIVIADLVRGFSVLGLALALFFHHENTQLIVILFFIVSIFNGLSKAFFQPAIDACIPDLVSSKALGKTLAFFGTSSQISMLVGQALGGLLYRLLGAPVLLLVDAISYIYSGLSEIFIKIEHVKKPLTQKSNGDVLLILISEIKEGFDYLKQNRGLFKMIGIVSSINFFVAPIMLFLPFYVSEHMKLGADWYGFMLASMALGSVIGYWLSSILNYQDTKRAHLMAISLFLSSTCLASLSFSNSGLLSISLFAFSGLFLGIFNLQAMTLFQSTIPTYIRGRVFSLLTTISSGLLPLGWLIGGLIGELINNNTSIIYLVAGTAMAITSTTLVIDKDAKKFLATQTV